MLFCCNGNHVSSVYFFNNILDIVVIEAFRNKVYNLHQRFYSTDNRCCLVGSNVGRLSLSIPNLYYLPISSFQRE
jgi:hypothetical protein